MLLVMIWQKSVVSIWHCVSEKVIIGIKKDSKLNHSLIIVKDERWWWFQRDTLGVNSTWFSTVIIGVVTRVTYYLNRLFMWTVIVCIAQIKVAPGSFITPKAIYGLNITRHAVGTCTFLRDVVLVTTTTAQILLHQECVA